MSHRLTIATLLATAMSGTSAAPPLLNYQPGLENAIWEPVIDARSCSLDQPIPGYGSVHFRRQVGREMIMELESRRIHVGGDEAEISLHPPEWRPGVAATTLGTSPVIAGRAPLRLEGRLIDHLTTALEAGLNPVFRYQDPRGIKQIRVGLNALQFAPAYRQFLECNDTLVPEFDSIRHRIIEFGSDSTRLTDEARDYLDLVVEYVKATGNVRKIVIDGHSDMRGTTEYNNKVSLTRAANVELYLTKYGVPKRLTKLRAFGRTRPIAENKTPEGRAKNRRVEMELIE